MCGQGTELERVIHRASWEMREWVTCGQGQDEGKG